MAFWSSETLRTQIEDQNLICPFDIKAIKHGAYEMALGPETFVTSTAEGTKRVLKEGEQLRIPPGQIALLMTSETVKVPSDSIAFISMRAGVKLQGLINISGFHVDPGFEGQLKY
jgi:dCTP deaminase